MIPLINHDFQWGRSEVVISYPYIYIYHIHSIPKIALMYVDVIEIIIVIHYVSES